MIRAVPAFEDNYIWIIGCDTEAADEVVVVDPGDSAPVLEDLSQRGLKLAAILITHHHRDHIGGIAELRPLKLPTLGDRSAGSYP